MSKSLLFRFLKWFFGIIAGIVVLITLLLFIYKDEICGLVVDEVNHYLKSEVKVSDVELTFWGSFPNLSVDFNNVFIRDSYENATEHDTLLYSERIRLKFNPMDMWRENYELKSIEISPGVLTLKVNEDSLRNYDIFRDIDEDEKSDGLDLKLKEVAFENFRFNYINAISDQEYRTALKETVVRGEFTSNNFIAQAESDLQIVTARSGKIALVNDQPATLKIGVEVNRDSSFVRIPKSTIYVSNLPFDFNGEVRDSTFFFNLNGKQISIKDAANNLAMKETGHVKNFDGSGVLLFNLSITGDKAAEQAVSVDCSFGLENGILKDPSTGITLSNMHIDGKYSNKGGPSKEKLELKNVSFATKGGPFKGELTISKFASPIFQGNADGTIDLSVFHSLFRLPNIEKLTGTVDVHSDFIIQGVPNEQEDMNYTINACNGNARLNGVDFSLIGDKRVYENIRGRVYLKNEDIGIDQVSLNIGGSDFRLNGTFGNLSQYLSKKGNIVANVDIYSKRINIDEDLTSIEKEEKIQQGRSFILPNNIDGKVYLEAGKMIYSKHTFEDVKGNMEMIGRRIHFPKLSISNAGSEALASLTIAEETPEIFRISSQIISKDVNFTRLFKEWDNFRQQVITSQNIEGDMQANIEFEALFDSRSGIIPKSIVARIGIQIDNGRLKNVETFDAIIASLKTSGATRLALKKNEVNELGKKLKDIRFERLTNTIVIRDEVMVIPTMKIISSAMEIDLSGRHTFDNIVDYKFAFYFRDLKVKRESEFGVEEDDGLGFHIFMRMHGDLFNPSIEWDKAARKERTKEINAQEKEDIKSMLKSEFGLFKKDTTVREYVKKKRSHEEMEVEFNPTQEVDPLIEEKKPKKDKKLPKFLKNWKDEQKESDKIEVEIEN